MFFLLIVLLVFAGLAFSWAVAFWLTLCFIILAIILEMVD